MTLNLNNVHLAGRLTRDPEVKPIGNDNFVAHMGMAINRRFKDKEEVTFVDVTAFGRTAENCGQYLHKGSAVYIEGYLKLDEWKTKEGQARQMLKVVANTVQFLDPKKQEDELPPKRTVTTAKDPFAEDPF